MLYSIAESDVIISGRLPPKEDPSNEQLEAFYVEERVKRASDSYLRVESKEGNKEGDGEGCEEGDEEGGAFANEELASD